jgi:glycosyltransferase involved in cell wall biosynthesis
MRRRGEWDGLIVLCAANSMDSTKVADWHLAQHLSRLVPVLYVDPVLSVARAALAEPRLRVLRPGLARLTPVAQPAPRRRGMTSAASALARRALRRAVRALGTTPQAVISAWALFPVLRCCDELVSVYWAQDDYVGLAGLQGTSKRLIEAREPLAAADAGLIIAANPVVAAQWRNRGNNPELIPFGVDVAAYAGTDDAPLPRDVSLPGPAAGFVGRLNARTDLRLLEAVADRGCPVLITGPVDPAFEPQRMRELLRRPAVRWTGERPFAELPGYMRMIGVGMVPYRTDDAFNRGSFPLKTLEYLAAGRSVVATDLPAVRWLNTGLIKTAGDPAEFANAVAKALETGPEQAAERRAFAARHSWERRAGEFLKVIMQESLAGCRPPTARRARSR